MRKFFMNLGGSNVTAAWDTSTTMFKQTVDIHLPIMTQIIKMPFDNDLQPNDQEVAEVSQTYKKKKDLDKENLDLSVFYLMCQRSLK